MVFFFNLSIFDKGESLSIAHLSNSSLNNSCLPKPLKAFLETITDDFKEQLKKYFDKEYLEQISGIEKYIYFFKIRQIIGNELK
jgi:hypothetical protein